ncbi:Zn-dependent oxidoreductase [Luteibacter aegosomaticola]|uniref:Zn-dependent oxidoreductase n=1 Tax=Luteibacter aegosomaticola TaxID=2911538 RepID=UPI001FFAF494|nr:Zn-dependent oxidoreductase [Luteibacter aegosomaticola]UPG90843.1 Zn-dependent oxidoreductase [Luteibacter aegosomaticola]
MKALCVTPERHLALRDVPPPIQPAAEHVLVTMEASAINHGDITFLRSPAAVGTALKAAQHDVWGASGAGRVTAVGEGVPAEYLGCKVAIYRSLRRTPETLGLWSEQAQMHFSTCLILPEEVDAVDYSGSLVNVMTAYAFIEEVTKEGHRGIVVTAGNSATGLAMAALARRRGMPSIFLVRSEGARVALIEQGIEHVVDTSTDDFADTFERLTEALGTTAVFEGVGGDLPGRIAPLLPVNSAMYFYGFLGGQAPFSLTTLLVMAKNLTLKRFSNFESATVKQPGKLQEALRYLQDVIGDPLFRTRLGQRFTYEAIDEALAYAGPGGTKAVLTAF